MVAAGVSASQGRHAYARSWHEPVTMAWLNRARSSGERVAKMRSNPNGCGRLTSLVAVACAAVGLVAQVAAGGEFWMEGEELKETFSGVTIDGHYSDGRYFTERYGRDMALQYSEGPREVSGHWSVISGAFCTIYENDPAGGCFRVVRVGANCFEFYFVTRSEEEAEAGEFGKPGWTARGWVKGRRSTCQEEPIV